MALSGPPQTMVTFREISIAGRKRLCMSGKVVLWSKHFDIRIYVSISYLKSGTIYIVGPVIDGRPREAPGNHGRPRETTGGQFPRTDFGLVKGLKSNYGGTTKDTVYCKIYDV